MKRILFVDDDVRILDGIRRMFHGNRHRWETHFSSSGPDALRTCQAVEFDVVISDMHMPGMDGFTLLQQIRERFPHAIRIVLSGYSELSVATRSTSVAHRVLSKPCSPHELQSTIERVIALQDLVNVPHIRKLVGSASELPSLSNTVRSLTDCLSKPTVSVGQVAEIIERDVAMSAKVLQLANSAFFGIADRVTTISQAVTFLGLEVIKNLALIAEAFKAFVPDRRITEAACTAIQDHAMKTAAIVRRLPIAPEIRDITIVAALLHDIGQLFIACKMPDIFCAAATELQKSGYENYEAEEALLGTSHAEIGGYLLGLWGLPDMVVEAVANHHHLERRERTTMDCAVAVHLADLLAHNSSAPQTAIETSNTNWACLESLGLVARLEEFRSIVN